MKRRTITSLSTVFIWMTMAGCVAAAETSEATSRSDRSGQAATSSGDATRQPATSHDAFVSDMLATFGDDRRDDDPRRWSADANEDDREWGVLGDTPSFDNERPMVLPSREHVQPASPRSESEHATRLAAEAIIDHLPNLYHGDRGELLGILDAQRRYILRLAIDPRALQLHASERPVPEHMRSNGVRAVYHVNVVDGVSFEAKKWNSDQYDPTSQAFPYLHPWVTEIGYAQIFRPIEVVFYEAQEPLVHSPFESLRPLDQVGRAKLYNLSQDSFLDPGDQQAMRDVRRLLAGSFHTIESSLFICRTTGSPRGRTAHVARSADHAMTWDSSYAQSTRVIVREVVGRSQVWIDAGEVSQVDRVNGIIARGTARIRARGFSRVASVSVETQYLRREDLTIRPDEPWSSWEAPKTYAMDWEYTVAEDGTVTWSDETGGLGGALHGTGVPRDPSLYGQVGLLGPLGEPTQRFAVSRSHLSHFLEQTGYRRVELPPEQSDASTIHGLFDR